MEEQIEPSDSYAAVEKLIQVGEVMLSDAERLLDTLRKQERITPSEQEALLELAWRMRMNSHPPA
jgi:hypothetical protein